MCVCTILTDCDCLGVGVVDRTAEGLDADVERGRSGGHVGELPAEFAEHLVRERGHRGHLPERVAQRAIGDGFQFAVVHGGHAVLVVQFHAAQVDGLDGALHERHGWKPADGRGTRIRYDGKDARVYTIDSAASYTWPPVE